MKTYENGYKVLDLKARFINKNMISLLIVLIIEDLTTITQLYMVILYITDQMENNMIYMNVKPTGKLNICLANSASYWFLIGSLN